MKTRNTLIALFGSLFLFSSCEQQSPGDSATEPIRSSGKPVVQAVNYPLFYLANRLAGEDFDVRFIAPPDIDPAFWKPSDDDIIAFQHADLILANGADYAKWMKSVSLPKQKILNTSADFSIALIREEGETHQHGNGEAHSHGELAFTVWLDFELAGKQALAIANQFAAMKPESVDQIDSRLKEVTAELNKLDSAMKSWAEKWRDAPLLVSHPVYQYWARRYGLNVKSLHWEPEMEWSPERDKELADINRDHKARWMVWENEPDAALVAELKKIGIESTVFNPCGNRPATDGI